MRDVIDEMHPENARQIAEKDAVRRRQEAVANAVERVKNAGGSDRQARRAGARALLAEQKRIAKGR